MLQQTSSDSVKIISIDRDKVLSRLEQIARQIHAEHPEVDEVRVFGSIARGDHVGTSDVDVIIVLRDGDLEDPLERVRSFYPYFDLPIGVDILVWTRDELERRLQRRDPSVERIWQESRPL